MYSHSFFPELMKRTISFTLSGNIPQCLSFSLFPHLQICRLQRHLSTGNYQQNLFSNQPVMFVSPTSQPPCKNLIELIQLSGGKVCKALRQAKICIGKYPGKKYQEIKCLSEKWILGKTLYFNPYKILWNMYSKMDCKLFTKLRLWRRRRWNRLLQWCFQ